MFVRQYWRDSRLANTNLSSNSTLINDYIDDIWIPDLYLPTEKDSKKSDVTASHYYLRIKQTGDLIYSQRVTATIICDMKLHNYPFDVQKCQLRLESCKHYLN